MLIEIKFDMKKKIIVIEDEKDIVDLVSYNLQKEGFEVAFSLDGEDALNKIKKGKYDLIVLDLMLPGIKGLELCKILKGTEETAHIPIIMLTAKGEEIDKIVGLEMGADDYITKPFSPREMVARVKAVLRRSVEKPKKDKVLMIGNIEVNTETYQVRKRNKPVKLSTTEFKLLLFLMEREGKVFTRDMLLDAAWKDEAFVEPRTVDVHIRRLRAQIEDDPSKPEFVKTRRGFGYYFEGNI